MIHYSDIQDALTRRGISDLEDAFRAFVGFPNEDDVKGIDTLDDFMATFLEICEALRGDERIMPEATAEILREVAARHDRTMPTIHYASGAWMALDHMPYFRREIRRHFDDRFIGDLANVVEMRSGGEG